MRGAVAAGLLLVGGCSAEPEATNQAMQADAPAAPSAKPAAPVATPTASADRLSGQVSALTGDVSGFAVRVTGTERIIELAADTLFEFDSATLADAAETNLLKTAEAIRASGPGAVRVIGHTDAKGEDAYNLDLSKRRAEAVAAWLRGQAGVRQREIVTDGRGEAQPVAPNAKADGSDDPNGRARNRRVEVIAPR